MKYLWIGAVALCGALAVSPVELIADGDTKETPAEPDVPAFKTAADAVDHLNAEETKLGKKSKLAARLAFYKSAIKVAKKYLDDHEDAADKTPLYEWMLDREPYMKADQSFVEVARQYLKTNDKLSDPVAYALKRLMLVVQLFTAWTDKFVPDAEAELKRLDVEAAKDALTAVFCADVRIASARAKKDDKGADEMAAALKKNTLISGSNEAWVYRSYQRLLLEANRALLNEGEKFPCWSDVVAVKDLDGKEIKLADYKGKVVLVAFWAASHDESIKQMPDLIRIYKDLNKKGLEVIGVSFDRSTGEQTLRDTIAGKGKVGEMPWREIYDGGHWASGLLRRHGLGDALVPRAILIDKDGNVAAMNWRFDGVEAKARELVAK